MEKENATLLRVFVLIGLTDRQELKISLFLLFLVVYLITMMGNLGLIVLFWNDPHLPTPMYLFLGCLAFVDAWLSSTVIPKMLVSFLAKNKMITLSECMIQCFSFLISENTECFILATMAYVLYLALCHPLFYSVIMTSRLCIQMSVWSFVSGHLLALIHEGFLFRLTFCKSNIINHFYCDIIPLLKISCTDTSVNFLVLFIFSGSIQVFTILTVLISYTSILFTVLKKKSEKGIRKAFSTCRAHLFSVSLYFGPLLFMYVHPRSPQADDQDMIESLIYTVIIPLLNPFIYSLRN
ncbi:olfactory receptor 5H8-like [Dasypus novemcinctus]|uniref:olfactory receptor 5H8-like n=1 Tax=Dasypus novemcinctus TaxID=9361 RepID=UPI00062AB02F|nr:olfactory receptor 5H8-like [Dasypus novemcinctus]